MPRKLGKGKMISNVEDRFAGHSFRRKIHVDSEGNFKIYLPDFVNEAIGRTHVSDKTKDGVIFKLSQMEKEYLDAVTNYTKVIVYEVKVNAFIMDETGETCIFRESEISFSKGTGLTMDWKVLHRHVRADNEQVKYAYPNGSHYDTFSIGNDRDWLPWTQQSEDFFREAQKRLEFLAKNLHEFLNQKPDVLEVKILEASGLLDYKPEVKKQ